MMKLIHAFFNMDTNSVELTYNDGSVLTIDCEEVENYASMKKFVCLSIPSPCLHSTRAQDAEITID